MFQESPKKEEEEETSTSWVPDTSLATVFFEQIVNPRGPLRLDMSTSSVDSLELIVETKNFEKEGVTRTVLQDLSLIIPQGEFLCMNGPNGCGKTTLLKIIAGLDRDFAGKRNGYQTKEDVGFVFQNYKESLFPWMNNLDNISYSSLLRRASKKARTENVRTFLEKYDLAVDLRAFPYQQSGGQQQIVSILRAMLNIPRLLIMDEPFSSLDQNMRLKMSDVIQEYWAEFGSTLVFVSHDLDESLLLADRLIVLRTLMPQGGTSLLGSFGVDFPRPRKSKLIESIGFFNVKSQILTLKRKDVENG
jgi:NitT/TauT family transport system ATP-binding protein